MNKLEILILVLIVSLLISSNTYGNVQRSCELINTAPNKHQTLLSNLNLSCAKRLNLEEFAQLSSLIVQEHNNKGLFNSQPKEDDKVYDELVLMALERYKADQSLTSASVLLQLLDQKKLATLQGFFDDDCSPLSNDQIQPEGGHAILYMQALSNGQLLSLLLTDGVLPIININSQKEIEPLVGDFRDSIQTLKGIMDKGGGKAKYSVFKGYGSKLYKYLLNPYSSHLANNKVKHLTIIPDSRIGIFPIGALWDPAEDEYVVDKEYSTSYSPNLSRIVKNTNKSKNLIFVTEQSEAIGAQNSGESSYLKDFEYIKGLFSNSKKIQQKNATKYGLLDSAKHDSIGVLFIAAHAQFNEDFNSSFIQLYDDGVDKNKGKIFVREFERIMSSASTRSLAPDLLVLSACETAQGGGGDVNASLGLAGVAARSGINSVIASLWEINLPDLLVTSGARDKSLGDDYQPFFVRLSNGESKAKALQKSKQKIKDNRSVYHWAAFVLVGDWGSF